MRQSNNEVFLNREYSDTIKGILIILIVIGHNHVLCPNTEAGGIMEYLYMFHVAGFFILPFFYDTWTNVTLDGISKTIIRCWVPYFWICVLCFMVLCTMKHQFDFSREHIYAFFQGTQTPIRKYFGFVFPWFLPTYCSFYILLLFARKYRWLYVLLFLLSIGTFFMTWNQFYYFKNTIPLGIGLALTYFSIGVIAFELNRYSMYMKYIGIVVFIILSACWWMEISTGVLLKLISPAFFLTLLCVVPHLKCKWLECLGNYSLGIYLLHVFFTNLTYILLPRTIFWGCVGFVISLLIPLLITMGILRIESVRKVLFPRSWSDFIHTK